MPHTNKKYQHTKWCVQWNISLGETALDGLGLLKLEPCSGDRKWLPEGKLKAGVKCDRETEMNRWQVLYFAQTAT